MITFRPLVVQTVFALATFIGLCWLGLWQLERLTWKLALIEAVELRSVGEAEPFTGAHVAARLDDVRYQKVALTGTFDHAREVFVYAPHRQGTGFRVITPLFTSGGLEVLVDRGWVPADKRAAETRSGGQPQGPVSFEGLIISGGEATMGVAARQDGEPIWSFRDLVGMNAHMELASAAPFFVIALPKVSNSAGFETWPRAEAPDLVFTNNHLSYVITWFGLAFALLCVYIAYHVSLGRLGFKPSMRGQPPHEGL